LRKSGSGLARAIFVASCGDTREIIMSYSISCVPVSGTSITQNNHISREIIDSQLRNNVDSDTLFILSIKALSEPIQHACPLACQQGSGSASISKALEECDHFPSLRSLSYNSVSRTRQSTLPCEHQIGDKGSQFNSSVQGAPWIFKAYRYPSRWLTDTIAGMILLLSS
jgi:hypothetical protein